MTDEQTPPPVQGEVPHKPGIAKRGWLSFRALPGWAQIVMVVLAVAVGALAAGSGESDDEAEADGRAEAEDESDRVDAGDDEELAAPETTTVPRAATTRPRATTTTVPLETLPAEVNAEVQRACDAVLLLGTSASSAVDYESSWTPVVDEDGLVGAVQGCVQQAEAVQAEAAVPPDIDAIIKDPDAVEGQVFLIVVEILQYDAATGPCAFRGYWDTRQREYNFEYEGDNALFSAGDAVSECPALGGIDQEDVVRVWARSTGSFAYDTQIGGNTTAPSFHILKAELIQKK